MASCLSIIVRCYKNKFFTWVHHLKFTKLPHAALHIRLNSEIKMNTQDSQSSQPQEDAPHRFRTEIRSLGYGHKPFNSSQSAVPNATGARSLGYGHKPYKRFQSLPPSAAARKASQNDQQPEKVLLTLFTKTDTPSPPSSASSDTDIDTDTEPISAITQQPDQPQGSHTVTNQPQALSTTSVAAHSTQPSLLPDHIFVSSVGKPYNRDWITKHGIDETVLQGFSSKHQFRSLIANDVIKLGDKLRMTYNNGNEAVHKEGTVCLNQSHDPA